jgi:hypothetical protein
VKTLIFLLSLLITVASCQKDKKEDVQETIEAAPAEQVVEEAPAQEIYVPQSTDEQTANNLRYFLTQDFLKDDLELLQPADRKFQFYKIDLNDDGNEEIFVRFMGPYFCGTGGCTFLLLDKYGEIITRFTVTRAPFYAETTRKNGWRVLVVWDSGELKELLYSEGGYPSNPTVLPKAPYDAPSGHATVIFGEDFSKAKTFEF